MIKSALCVLSGLACATFACGDDEPATTDATADATTTPSTDSTASDTTATDTTASDTTATDTTATDTTASETDADEPLVQIETVPYGGAITGEWLAERIATRLTSTGAPAYAAAVVIKGEVVATAVTGVRKAGSPQPVRLNDPFHIGSVTKPITGTLVGIYVDRGIIAWDTRVLEVFPELASIADPAYEDITVRDLMAHISGMPYKPRNEPDDEWRSVTSDLRARRYEYVKSALGDVPEAPPGTQEIYGGGSIIVAAMLEELTDSRWEDLVAEDIGAPLGWTTLRFGGSAAPDAVDALWEHVMDGGVLTPVASPSDYANEVHGPAGRNLFLSVGDLARFTAAWLPSAPNPIVSDDVRAEAELGVGIAVGHGVVWGINRDDRVCGRSIAYGGSNGFNWTFAWVAPQRDIAVVVDTNLGGDAMPGTSDSLIDEIIAQLDAEGTAPCLPESVGPSLLIGKTATASNVYRNASQYGAGAAIDGTIGVDSRWATDDGTTSAWLEVDLGEERDVGRLAIFEQYNRVEEFVVKTSLDQSEWTTVYSGRYIGPRLRASFTPVRARYARLEIVRATNPSISEFALYPE